MQPTTTPAPKVPFAGPDVLVCRLLRAETLDKDRPLPLTPNAEPRSESTSRRAFVTKAATAAGIAWAAPVIATINQPAAAAHSLPILVSGNNFSLIAPPATVASMQSDTTVFGFAENCVTLASSVLVNATGANGALFTGTPGTVSVGSAGQEVCSYYIRSERVNPPAGPVAATVNFVNATIIGLAYLNPQLDSTRTIFGLGGGRYGATGRLESNDFGVVITDGISGDSSASLSLYTDGLGGADSIRILVVPS